MSGNQFHTCSMGLHYVCYRLAKQGWHVSTSCRHAKSPAIGKCWRTSGQSFSFQTTGQRGKDPIMFSGGAANITEPFLISVVNLDDAEPEVYVFTADEARNSMVPKGRLGRHFIQVPVYNKTETDKFSERWDKLETYEGAVR